MSTIKQGNSRETGKQGTDHGFQGSLSAVARNRGLSPIYLSSEISHEQIFFEDGKSPANIGFFDDGTLKEEPNPTGYRCKSGQYNDCIMRKAVGSTPPPPNYCIIGRNCQTWAERVRKEYGRLAKDPQVQKECGVCQ